MLPQSKIPKFGLAALAVAAIALFAAAPGARADLIVNCQATSVTPGGCVQGNVNGATSNILFNGPDAILTGTTVQGDVQNTTTPFDFHSTTDAMQVNNANAGGAATITSTTDNFIENLSYFVPNPPGGLGFTELDTNLQLAQGSAGGTVDFTVSLVNSLGVAEAPVNLATIALGAGDNKFAFIAINGEVITNVTYNATGVNAIEVETVKQNQVNLAPIPTTPVPEPASLMIFGTALAGLGLVAGRRRRKDA